MLVDAVGQAQVHQRVAALAQRDRARHGRVAGLHLQAAAHAQAPLHRRQRIVRPQTEDVPGREAGEGLAAGLRVGQVLAGVEGVAGRHRPVRRDAAAGLGLEAAAAHLAARHVVAVLADAGPGRILLRAVLLADLERGQRYVQRAVHQFALDAGLVVGAGDRVQPLAVARELGLRLEHLGIAAVQRPLAVQIDDQPAVGREFGVDALSRTGRVLVPPAHAAAQHQRQWIGQGEAAHAVDALLARARLARRGIGADARLRHAVRIPVEHVHWHAQRRRQLAGVLLGRGALRIAADQQLVAPAEQLHRAADVGIDAGLGVVEFVGAAHQRRAQASLAVDRAIGAGVLQVAVGGEVVGAELGAPALAEAVFQVGEHARRVPVEAVPGRVQVGRALQADVAAILVAWHARHVGGGADALVLQPGRQYRVRAQVDLADAVEQRRLLVRHVVEIAAVFKGRDETAAHAAAGVERAAQVGLGAVAVPVASADRAAEGELALRTLAHQVDGGGGIAGAMQQAVGAAQDLDALVHRHVLRRRGHVAHQHRHPILLVRIDLEAAGIVGRGQQLVRLHRDAGGVQHDVIQALQVLLPHLFLADHGDRLRRLAHRQGQLAHRGRRRGRVAFAADGDRRQGRGIVGRLRRHRPRRRQCQPHRPMARRALARPCRPVPEP